MGELFESINELMAANQQEKRKVAIWGAGIKGITTLALLKSRGIEYIVDTDPTKKGLYSPVSHIPIVHPEEIDHNPFDVIVISAVMYLDEIVEQLRKELDFKGEI